jgi:hypothetical protein
MRIPAGFGSPENRKRNTTNQPITNDRQRKNDTF